MAYSITDTYDNVFNFHGAAGNLPGSHGNPELLSGVELSNILSTLNKFSYLSFYSYVSPEGHYSMFYGSVSFRSVSGTLSGFVNGNFSNYGIALQEDTTDIIEISDVFDSTSSMFNIPLLGELVFEPYAPYVRLGIIPTNPLYKGYRPIFDSYSYSSGRTINFKLFD